MFLYVKPKKQNKNKLGRGVSLLLSAVNTVWHLKKSAYFSFKNPDEEEKICRVSNLGLLLHYLWPILAFSSTI